MFVRIFCAAAICITLTATAIQAAETEVGPVAGELTPGQWYQVKYARDGVHEDGFGMLVKADDQWLTLAFIVRSRSEQGVPVLSKTPYVNRLFKNVGLSESHVTVFVPRDAVSQIAPMEMPPKEGDRTQVSEFPQPGDGVTVCYSEGGEQLRKRGKLVSVDSREVVISCQEVVAQTSSVPVISQIPLVGGMFSKQVFTRHDVNTSIAADHVLCLSMTGSFIERTVEEPNATE